jgi:hypothetical protein
MFKFDLSTVLNVAIGVAIVMIVWRFMKIDAKIDEISTFEE